MSATIKDIARTLGISTSTVSYALNDGPRPVPAAVKAEVLRVAKELDYRPNRIAKSLVTRRLHTIGVLPTEASENLPLAPYFQLCLNGIMNQAEALGHDVLIYSRFAAGVEHDQDVVNGLTDGRTDGVVLLAPFVDAPFLKGLSDRGVRFTVVSAVIPGATCFTCDNFAGVHEAIDHLVGLGHKEIAHLAGWQSLQDGIERRAAFLQSMRRHGLQVREDWIRETLFNADTGYEQARALLDSPHRPTAVFCANDEVAVGAYKAAWDLGVPIPLSLSVVGFDDGPPSRVMLPAMTTVAQPIEHMCRNAVSALVDQIENRTSPSRVFQAHLLARGSTAPAQV